MPCRRDNLRKPVIGLLGAPGSGKSWVASQLARLGCGVIDADAIARQLLATEDVEDQLVKWWGPGIIKSDGHLDRKAIARIVFCEPEQRERLEGLIHPKVHETREALRQQFRRDPEVKVIVEDVPLLMEVGLDADCDVLVFVDAPLAVRQQRVAAERGWTAADLAAREKNQMPLDMKRRRADYVISNNADPDESMKQVRRVFSLISQARAE